MAFGKTKSQVECTVFSIPFHFYILVTILVFPFLKLMKALSHPIFPDNKENSQEANFSQGY